jgi:hypothetical protein
MTVNEHTYPPGSPSGSNQRRGWSYILPFGCLVAVVVKTIQQSHQEPLEHSEINGSCPWVYLAGVRSPALAVLFLWAKQRPIRPV